MHKICIYAICKNESKFLHRWYEHIKDADYIRVLDTGSTDSTLDILESFKQEHPEQFDYAQKEIKPWRFDTARNESMKLVPQEADIIVSADIDDVFIPEWRSIIEEDIDKGYNKIYGRYPYYDENNNIIGEIISQDRVSLNDGKSHWENAIHERLVTENENAVHDNRWVIEHRQDFEKERREVYLEASKNGLKDGGDYAKLCYGYELANSGKTHEAIRVFIDLYDELSNDSEYRTRKMVVFIGDLLVRINDYEDAISWYEAAKFIDKKGSPFEDYFLYDSDFIDNRIKAASKPFICVYTICKNEEKHLHEWFNRVKSADLVCVLDTGSTDSTLDILSKLSSEHSNLKYKTITYEEFLFGTARNDSLSFAKTFTTGKNNIVYVHLDLDEMLEYNGIEEIRRQWSPEYDLLELTAYNVNNMVSIKGHKEDKDLVWQYDIHEKIAYNDFRETKSLLIRGTGYNHYQDLSKTRDYYGALKRAYAKYPTCIHYLTYLIWEASLHNEQEAVIKYAEEDMYQILSNKSDEHYRDWKYYIYACSVLLSADRTRSTEYRKHVLQILDAQDESFRAYYLYKANLCHEIGDYNKELNNLIRASLTPVTNSWIEGNFGVSHDELLLKIELLAYYNCERYDIAYFYADKLYNISESDLNKSNLEFCKNKYMESLK